MGRGRNWVGDSRRGMGLLPNSIYPYQALEPCMGSPWFCISYLASADLNGPIGYDGLTRGKGTNYLTPRRASTASLAPWDTVAATSGLLYCGVGGKEQSA